MGALANRLESPVVEYRGCSEETLLRGVLERNERAWAEFIRRYRALIYHCIAKVMSRYSRAAVEADLDEMYAEVLMVLVRDDMRKLRIYNPERGSKLGSWIGLLTINATHDHLRSSARHPWRERLEPAPGSLPVNQQVPGLAGYNDCPRTPLEQLLAKERWSHLETILADFSQRDRTFLQLYYNQGMEAAGVAECMSISVKTVYSKKHKIRAHLRRSVREQGQTCAIHDLAS